MISWLIIVLLSRLKIHCFTINSNSESKTMISPIIHQTKAFMQPTPHLKVGIEDRCYKFERKFFSKKSLIIVLFSTDVWRHAIVAIFGVKKCGKMTPTKPLISQEWKTIDTWFLYQMKDIIMHFELQ